MVASSHCHRSSTLQPWEEQPEMTVKNVKCGSTALSRTVAVGEAQQLSQLWLAIVMQAAILQGGFNLSWHTELSTWLLPSSRVCRKGMSALKAATSAGRTAGQVATSAWQKPGASPSLSSCKEVHACRHATRMLDH